MPRHEHVVRWLFDDVWSRGRTAALRDQVGEGTFRYGGAARPTDGVALAPVVDDWRRGFPDLRFDIEELVESGDRVAVRAQLRGTHEGEWRGHAPTGRRMDVDVMGFFRFDADCLVEIWEVDDAARRDRQLGLGGVTVPGAADGCRPA
jgi:predicted ester cyclase